MFENLKKTRQLSKMIYDHFYLEKQYKKIAKRKDLCVTEKMNAFCDELYEYFEKAFDEVVQNDYRGIVLYGIMDLDGVHCENENIEKIKDKRAEQKVVEIAGFFANCKAKEQDLQKVEQSTRNLFNLSIATSLKRIDNFGFEMLKTKFIDIKKQELENQREQ